MRFKRKKETGALAIDAVIGICMFILTILAIMFMALMIRVQANMQYALSQTAKEISGYFYLLDKVGMTSIVSGATPAGDIGKANEINQNIGLIVDFAGGLQDTATDISGAASPDEILAIMESDGADLQDQFNQVKTMLQSYDKTKLGDQLKLVMQIFGRTLVNTAFGELVAPLACECLMPKYLTSGDVEDYYNSLGIDPDTVRFNGSELIKDGRSIKLVCSYEMDLSKFTFGLVHKTLKCQQIATTAAWVKPNERGTIRSLVGVIEAPSEPPSDVSRSGGGTPDPATPDPETPDSETPDPAAPGTPDPASPGTPDPATPDPATPGTPDPDEAGVVVPPVAGEVEEDTTEEENTTEEVTTEVEVIVIKCRNQKLAGKTHPKTGVPFEKRIVEVEGQKYEVVVPCFDSAFDAQLPTYLTKSSDKEQFKECNEQLKEKIERNPTFAAKFDDEQLEQIRNGETPDGYTWHHDSSVGKMQLVDTYTHSKTGHTGGRKIWGGGTSHR